MKNHLLLHAFCEGYRLAMLNERTPAGDTLASTDDWVVWGGYDINFAGADYSGHAKHDNDLHVDAYKAGWTDSHKQGRVIRPHRWSPTTQALIDGACVDRCRGVLPIGV
jgi:hypothetical protein